MNISRECTRSHLFIKVSLAAAGLLERDLDRETDLLLMLRLFGEAERDRLLKILYSCLCNQERRKMIYRSRFSSRGLCASRLRCLSGVFSRPFLERKERIVAGADGMKCKNAQELFPRWLHIVFFDSTTKLLHYSFKVLWICNGHRGRMVLSQAICPIYNIGKFGLIDLGREATCGVALTFSRANLALSLPWKIKAVIATVTQLWFFRHHRPSTNEQHRSNTVSLVLGQTCPTWIPKVPISHYSLGPMCTCQHQYARSETASLLHGGASKRTKGDLRVTAIIYVWCVDNEYNIHLQQNALLVNYCIHNGGTDSLRIFWKCVWLLPILPSNHEYNIILQCIL